MDQEKRTAILEAISRADDAVVLSFAGYVMDLIEREGGVSAYDAETFAARRGLIPAS